ncbi:hypothetical protein Pmani_025704 [Petrolisthes manimaculis]|uniref:Uncharacterized protein n=1 Tax=Petrolisthes manimaculis TaxID=1843537 RepID=A0AAE1TY60_9EUCA|nr:hypothetical protein Pmani_025704 [Petrolisthes manimaculis]
MKERWRKSEEEVVVVMEEDGGRKGGGRQEVVVVVVEEAGPSQVGGGLEGPKAAVTSPSPSTRHYRCRELPTPSFFTRAPP